MSDSELPKCPYQYYGKPPCKCGQCNYAEPRYVEYTAWYDFDAGPVVDYSSPPEKHPTLGLPHKCCYNCGTSDAVYVFPKDSTTRQYCKTCCKLKQVGIL